MSTPLLPPPPRSAKASRQSSRSNTPTPPLNQFNAFASSSSPMSWPAQTQTSPAALMEREGKSARRREETAFTEESDTSFGLFSGDGFGTDHDHDRGHSNGLGFGLGVNAPQDGRRSLDLMDFSSSFTSPHAPIESGVITNGQRAGPPIPSNIHRLPMPNNTSTRHTAPTINNEFNLLGSFDDPTPTSQHTNLDHHDHLLQSFIPTNDHEEALLKLEMAKRSVEMGIGGGDARLLPYRGEDADLPSTRSKTTNPNIKSYTPNQIPIPTPSTSTSTSTSSTSTHPTQTHTQTQTQTQTQSQQRIHPPRRLSQIHSYQGPSSPPAVSAIPGDSFVYRARRRSGSGSGSGSGGRFNGGGGGDGGGGDGGGGDHEGDDLEEKMVEAMNGERSGSRRRDANNSNGDRRTSVIDLLEDYEGSGQIYGQPDGSSGPSSSSSPPPATAMLNMRRLSSSFLRGPSGVGSFPRKVSASGTGDVTSGRARRGNGYGMQGGDEKSATMPTYTSKREESAERGYLDDADDGDDGGGEWGNYKRSPTLGSEASGSASASALAGMTKKFGLASLTGASKATDTLKSKWKTVLGPGTFSGSPTSPSSFASGSGSGNNFNAMRLGLDQEKLEELERPTFTAQPISITSETPFHFRDDSSSSYWSAPNGAPGFRNPNGLMSGLAPLSGTENGHGRVEDWSGTKLIGRREATTPVLDSHCADALRPSLPARQRLSNTWTLLFSLDQHGGSISTFYRLIEMHAQTHKFAGNLLVIKDTEDRRFGVYMNEAIKRVDGSYFGSGESWLFKIIGDDLDVRARTFKWTGRNQYFALCEGNSISFGGGDGKTGLYLDGSFVSGTSARCPAYENEVLCADEGSAKFMGRYDCVGLEVWGTS